MLSLAYFSPFRPIKSGISDYSHDLLPYLAQVAKITAVTPDKAAVSQADLGTIPLIDYGTFSAESHRFDLPIYHIGNSAHHNKIYEMLRHRPGIVVLHDSVLHEFMSINQYARALAYEPDQTRLDESPLNKRVLDLALGVIVHNRYSAEKITQSHPNLPVQHIQQPMDVVASRQPTSTGDDIVFGSLGQITVNKRLDVALDAFAQFYARQQRGRFIIIGEPVDVDVAGLIAQLPVDVQQRVEYTPFIADFGEFQQAIAAIDVVVTLRNPTLGETSAAALRALAQGKPLIVYDHGWYAELPESVAIKVGLNDVPQLVKAFERMAVEREGFSAETLPYIKKHHTPQKVAKQYIEFAQQILAAINKKFML